MQENHFENILWILYKDNDATVAAAAHNIYMN